MVTIYSSIWHTFGPFEQVTLTLPAGGAYQPLTVQNGDGTNVAQFQNDGDLLATGAIIQGD